MLRSVASQPDGKIVAAGTSGNGAFFFFLVTRHLANGRPDPSFGGGDGRIGLYFPGSNEAANVVRLQPDGKIVAAGYATKPDGTTQMALARLNSDGSPDTSFDGDGLKLVSVPGGSSRVNGLAFQTIGGQIKIVAVGQVA